MASNGVCEQNNFVHGFLYDIFVQRIYFLVMKYDFTSVKRLNVIVIHLLLVYEHSIWFCLNIKY